jgi:hypothetical protein
VHGILSDDSPSALAAEIQNFANDPTLGPRLAQAAFDRLNKDFLMAPGIAQLAVQMRAMLSGK